MEPIITIRNLTYSYPDGKQALQGIDLSVMPGEKIALMGANGAGKSTLLLHLNGTLEGSGEITVRELTVKKSSLPHIRALVGLVFQDPDDQLFSPTVFEDVAYGPIYQGLDKVTVQQRVAEALAAVHMEGFEGRNPYHLSSGEKKRVAIATVLAMRPLILALDEPTAGLDPRSCRELIALLKELPQTMLIATHDLRLAEELTPRIAVMNGGKIVADDASGKILRNDDLLLMNGLK